MRNPYRDVAAFLGGLPDHYLAFDTETNGLKIDSPSVVPTQIGFALVLDREVVEFGDFLLDWTRGESALDAEAFRGSLEETKHHMEKQGKTCHVDWPGIRSSGHEPVAAMARFRDLILEALAIPGCELVAHNGYGFDRVLLDHWWRRMGLDFEIDVERLIDTGLIEKSRRLGWAPPAAGTCRRREWYNKIRDCRSRVRWSLDEACEEEYGLMAKRGLDARQAHSAGFDAVACHYLLEEFRDRLDRAEAA